MTITARGAALLVTGVALLALRPILARDGHPVETLALLFVALLAAGLMWPERKRAAAHPALVTIAGVGAFLLARLLAGGHAPNPLTFQVVALSSLAAVAEEAFFRRLAYGVLAERGGALFAVGGSSLLFAIVHVPIYGWWVAPLDLAAGMVFGWQRWTSDRWSVSAVTHVAANLLVVI